MRRKEYLRRRLTSKTFCITYHQESARSVSYIFGRIYEINNFGRFILCISLLRFLTGSEAIVTGWEGQPFSTCTSAPITPPP